MTDIIAGSIGALAGIVVAILLASALALWASTVRRIRNATPSLEKRMKVSTPMATRRTE